MTRTSILILPVLGLLLGGCRDLGLPGNIPAEESRTATPPELVAQVTAPAEAEAPRLVVDGRLWVPVGQPSPRDPATLRPVGAAAGTTVYARTWDERPYRALFTRVAVPTADAAPTARAAMAAGLDHWQEHAPVTGRSMTTAAPERVPADPAGGAPGTTQPDEPGGTEG
jgi:hypothetical protein